MSETNPAGASQARIELSGSPKPSPSASAYQKLPASSSTMTSQSSSTPLQVSSMPGRRAGSESSQSVELETYPAGSEHASMRIALDPNPSPSMSR